MFDCAGLQGSRDQQMGCLGDPWILVTHQGLVVLETLLDQEVQRVLSLLSGRGHHQTQEYLAVQACLLILSHLAVLWGLEVPEALSDLWGPEDQGGLAPL